MHSMETILCAIAFKQEVRLANQLNIHPSQLFNLKTLQAPLESDIARKFLLIN